MDVDDRWVERVRDNTAIARESRSGAEHQSSPARVIAPGGFHLIDTTMMYAPRSGGVKRYLTAKRTWLERRRPDIRHTLVVPGRKTGLEEPGLYTVSATKLPFGDGYRIDRKSVV